MKPSYNQYTPISPLYKSNYRKYMLVGICIILLFVVSFIAWVFFAPLETGAIARGSITLSGYRRTIQHLEGGVIKEIDVQEGSEVKKGQVLIKLDDTRANIAFQLAHNETNELLAEQSRLIAERDKKNEILFPISLIHEQKNQLVSEILRNQSETFKVNQTAYNEDINILNQRIVNLNDQIEGTQSQINSINSQIKYTQEEMRALQTLAAKHYINRPRVLAVLRDDAKLEGSKSMLNTQISAIKEKIGEIQLQINTKNKEHLSFILTQLRETQQQLVNASEKEKDAKDVYQRTNIRSPHDGYVVGLKVHTIGEIIKPGDAIMDIVPKKAEMIVETRISPSDIDVIRQGLPVKVRFSSLPTSSPPTLRGTIITVPADTITDPKTNETYYLARVAINAGELNSLSSKQKLFPGMPVDVLIITAKLTPWQHMITPIKNSYARGFH